MLTIDEVNSIADGISDRAAKAAASIRGEWFISSQRSQSAAALETVANATAVDGHWRKRGIELAAIEATSGAADVSHEQSWRSAGAEYDKSIGEIDGYQSDARLTKVVEATVKQTANDAADLPKKLVDAAIKKAADIIPWYVYVGVGLALIGIVFVAVKVQ